MQEGNSEGLLEKLFSENIFVFIFCNTLYHQQRINKKDPQIFEIIQKHLKIFHIYINTYLINEGILRM